MPNKSYIDRQTEFNSIDDDKIRSSPLLSQGRSPLSYSYLYNTIIPPNKRRRQRRFYIIIYLFLGFLCIYTIQRVIELYTTDASTSSGAVQFTSPQATLHGFGNETQILTNATLGFSNIFAISLPLREDRKDELAMIAAASGLQVEFVDGIVSSELSKQTLPDEHGTTNVVLDMTHLACWRSHANVWRTIVDRNLPSALIIEDDVDWDLNIRESMSRIILGLGNITDDAEHPLSNGKWDMLYLGTCYEMAYEPEEMERHPNETYFVEIPGDEINMETRMFSWLEPMMENYLNSTDPHRILARSKNPACTHGYAISQRGAQRMLLQTNKWLPFPVDLTMIHYMQTRDFKSYSVFPPMLVQWRNTDDPSRNSDIDGSIELAHNWGFLRSARKHLPDWIELGFVEHYWWTELPFLE